MNVANYLSYTKQNASVRVRLYSNVIFTLFCYSFTLNQERFQCAVFLKFLSSFRVVLEVSLILDSLVSLSLSSSRSIGNIGQQIL